MNLSVIECTCPCHVAEESKDPITGKRTTIAAEYGATVMHVVACCSPCHGCGKKIRRGFEESHFKQAHSMEVAQADLKRVSAEHDWLVTRDFSAAGLAAALKRFRVLFGVLPHGTVKQMAALLELLPHVKEEDVDAPTGTADDALSPEFAEEARQRLSLLEAGIGLGRGGRVMSGLPASTTTARFDAKHPNEANVPKSEEDQPQCYSVLGKPGCDWRGDPKAVEAVQYLISIGFTSDDYLEADMVESGTQD